MISAVPEGRTLRFGPRFKQAHRKDTEDRTGFRHPHLLQWTKENRGKLVSAALTLLRAFVVVGKPKGDLPEYGSFESWSDLVRAALVWAGAEDCGGGRDALQEADPRLAAVRAVLVEWRAAFGAVQATLHDAIGKTVSGTYLHQSLVDALCELAPRKPDGTMNAGKLGVLFRAHKERVFGGLRLMPAGASGKHGQPWVVASV